MGSTMRLKLFFAGVALVAVVALLMAACGNGGNTNEQADGSGEDAGTDATVSNQDGQPSTDSGSPKDGAVDGSIADGSSIDGASEAGVVCSGPAGVLDTTFGDAGMVWLEYPAAQAASVAVQSDGKILVGGSTGSGAAGALVVVRLLPNGSLDSTFGTNGLVQTAFGKYPGLVRALAVQADGRIVAVGDSQVTGDFHAADFAVLRYFADGGLDPSFGDGGIVSTDFGSTKTNQVDDIPESVALLPDGRILVAGYGDPNDVVSATNYELARYNSDGSLDATFGNGGQLIIDVHGTNDSPGVATLVDGGKMIVAGTSGETASISAPNDVSVVQLVANGAFDPTFSDAGLLVQSVDPADGYPLISSVAVDANGRIMLAGSFATPGGDFGLIRLTPTGAFDPTFGDGGLVTTDFDSRGDNCLSVIIQPDGKLIAGGVSSVGAGTGANAIVRYLSTGALDLSFGVSGKILTLPPPNADLGVAGSIVSGCNLITVGTIGYDESTMAESAMGVARYSR